MYIGELVISLLTLPQALPLLAMQPMSLPS